MSYWWIRSKILDTPVIDCRYLEMRIWFTDIKSGTPYGKWELYARYNSSSWEKIGTFDLTEDDNEVSVSFSEPYSFTELVIERVSTKPCDHLYNYVLTFVQTY